MVKILVLGTAQDGGFPQTGCSKQCCYLSWKDNTHSRKVSSVAIISGDECWLIDITPDFSYQLKMIEAEIGKIPKISGIFITHAHIGHYLGLLDLGLEIMNTNLVPVHVMPTMDSFLKYNAPFTQLIDLKNIQIQLLAPDTKKILQDDLYITPFLVPHRNEFSETVGFRINSKDKSFIYIPDIDSWNKWSTKITDLIKEKDFLLLDGTFYDNKELENRNIKDIPHPFIKDSMKVFSLLEVVDRKKVYFTHLNHTNPAINALSPQRLEIVDQGYNVAEDGMIFEI